MSAWIVSKAHIDLLVQAMVVEGLIPMADATETGRMLWHENHLSIQARYGDDPDDPDVRGYVFEGIEAKLHDGIVNRQIHCYDYQTCEHSGWETSQSFALCERLSAVLIARNGGAEDLGNNVDRLGRGHLWGIDSLAEAIA